MKKLRMLWKIIRFCYADKITIIYIASMAVGAVLLKIFDPAFKSFGSAVWYIFSVLTTCGFGDVIPETIIGRVITIIIGLFSLLMVALITGVVVNAFTEFSKAKRNESVTEFIDQLEHLPELSKEELQLISDRIKKKRLNK